MSLRNLSDSDVESLIELWKNERALWDGLGWLVGWLATTMNYGKTTERIQLIFAVGLCTGHGYHMVTGGLYLPEIGKVSPEENLLSC